MSSTGAPRPTGTGRLFAALWPDDTVRRALLDWQRAVVTGPRARPTPGSDLHATLVFIGDLPADRLPAVTDALAVPGPPFTLTLDDTERWRDGLAVAVATQVPAPLVAWQAELAGRLRTVGLVPDDRPYRVHVTLARSAADVPDGAPHPPPLCWTPAGHVLAARDGAHYRVIRRYA